jgi:filamin
VDHKLKLILGLIWTLILHYSISLPVWDDDDRSGTSTQRNEQTPKQRLLAWIQNKVADRAITNFTTDWNDGCAIGALVDGIAPGMCLSVHGIGEINSASVHINFILFYMDEWINPA